MNQENEHDIGDQQNDVRNQNEPIDKKVLENLRELMEGEFLALIDLYLKNSPLQLGELKESSKKKDTHSIYRIAHSLKSSSSNIGADSLAALCKSLEAAGREGRSDGSDELIEKIEKEYKRVKVFLESQRSEAG